MIKDIKLSKNQSETVTKYILPKKIVTEKYAENTAVLLNENPRQALMFGDINYSIIHAGGYIVLDMGCEINGGIDITLERLSEKCGKVHVTFGESVMEALSVIGEKNATVDHSVRDFSFSSRGAMNMKLGDTGYRFVKIEAENDICLKTVYGTFTYRDVDYAGSFECDDEKINKIWSTGAYTVHLNMQDYLWDGIKRDRLVWIGDMHPEMLTICSVFGYNDVVPKSLDLVMNATPLEEWMNDTPTYTSWWIINQKTWYMQNGDYKYLSERADYLFRTIKKIIGCISDDGKLTYPMYFCDWSSKYTPDEMIGAYGVTALGLKAGAYLCECLKNETLAEKCRYYADILLKKKLDTAANKQTAALYALAGGFDCRNITEKLLLKNGSEGLSTFLGGYVLRVISKAGYTSEAIKIMKEYWGAMLDLGATTFWEDFDMDWVTERTVGIDRIVPDGMIDVHGDFGKYCYKHFRHSLCHGWASGPTSFLSQEVSGIKILEPGCKKILVQPKANKFKYMKTVYPTPYGPIEIEQENDAAKVKVPDGVELVGGVD